MSEFDDFSLGAREIVTVLQEPLREQFRRLFEKLDRERVGSYRHA